MEGIIRVPYETQKIRLFLCKPNGQTIAELSDAYRIQYDERLGTMDELTFNLPYEIDIRNNLERSRVVDEIKDRYLIRMERSRYQESISTGEMKEYFETIRFIINEIGDSGDNEEIKEIHCYSLEFELGDKILTVFETETAMTCTQIINLALKQSTGINVEALTETNNIWTIGYIDGDFDLSTNMRNHKADKKTVLEIILDLAKKYNAIAIFDTVKREINFRKPQDVGFNHTVTETDANGNEIQVVKPRLSISYGQYLKKAKRESISDEMVTRLEPKGKDGLGIQGATSTGSPYLEDFSYFMYPFKKDENGNVLSSSDYMSDGLCSAIISYNELVASKDGYFQELLDKKKNQDGTMASLEKELQDLEDTLFSVQSRLDVLRANDSMWYLTGSESIYANMFEGRDYAVFEKDGTTGEWKVKQRVRNYGQ